MEGPEHTLAMYSSLYAANVGRGSINFYPFVASLTPFVIAGPQVPLPTQSNRTSRPTLQRRLVRRDRRTRNFEARRSEDLPQGQRDDR
jgi:hypothetical protein